MGETSARKWARHDFDDAKCVRYEHGPHGTMPHIARTRMRNAWVAYHHAGHNKDQDAIARLTAEVERLRSILRSVVEWSEDTFHASAHCHMCDQTGDVHDLHDEHCPVGLARDALAREDGGA